MKKLARMVPVVVVGLLLVGASGACGKKKGAGSHPESADGLKSMFGELMDAVKKGDDKASAELAGALVVPGYEAWFKTTFGDEAGGRVSAEYAKNVPNASKDLPKAIAMFLKKGRTEVAAERFAEAGSPDANTYQDVALKAMKTKVPLYSVRLTEPGSKTGTHLYNFAYVDGGFRFVGKMLALDPNPEATPEVKAMSELRNKDREEFFKSGKLPGDK